MDEMAMRNRQMALEPPNLREQRAVQGERAGQGQVSVQLEFAAGRYAVPRTW